MADDFVAQTPTIESRTWFAIDGALEPIAFEGLSFFRFPQELARLVVDRFSKPGDLVLDPFCGFGTTLVATETLGRRAIGIEKDRERFEFASRRVHASSRVIHGSAFELDTLALPRSDLVFTSPPYTSFRDWDETGFQAYWNDFDSIFSNIRRLPSGWVSIDRQEMRDHIYPNWRYP